MEIFALVSLKLSTIESTLVYDVFVANKSTVCHDQLFDTIVVDKLDYGSVSHYLDKMAQILCDIDSDIRLFHQSVPFQLMVYAQRNDFISFCVTLNNIEQIYASAECDILHSLHNLAPYSLARLLDEHYHNMPTELNDIQAAVRRQLYARINRTFQNRFIRRRMLYRQ